MAFGFLNLLMLAGMAGLAIPILIHLLNRRRHVVVDWGAMQFLRISETTRRRFFLEELLLLLARMALIALLVLGLAAPYAEGPGLTRISGGERDLVLLLDGSASMTLDMGGTTTQERACERALDILAGLSAGDAVAVFQVGQQVTPIVPALTHDLDYVRAALNALPPPAGGCDWAQGVQAAHKLLATSTRGQRDIVLLGDNQRQGWADDASLLRWELFANTMKDDPTPRPGLWVVDLAPVRPTTPANWSFAPLRATRAVASVGQPVLFRTALEIRGSQEYRPPHALRVEVDGLPVPSDLAAPTAARLEKGQVPLSFRHRFPTAGSHLVTVRVDPDPPLAERPAGYVLKDQLPADNRQDFAIEVLPALPVLMVDGGLRKTTARRKAEFLRDALAPARDLTPAVLVRLISFEEFEAEALQTDVGKEGNTRPRVLILVDVPSLNEAQSEAISTFLAGGGGVLVTLGERANATSYNDDLYRNGQGWLPARLEQILGDVADPLRASSPQTSSCFHPALELFRDQPTGGLGEARFPRWWKINTPGKASTSVAIGLLTTGEPFLIEKSYRNGRILLSSVPLDRSWRTNLTELPAFVPLAHELVYYLAGARSDEHNLQPGQPIRFRPESEDLLIRLTLQLPQGPVQPLRTDGLGEEAYRARVIRTAQGSVVVHEATSAPGVYRLGAGESSHYYVVQADSRESDLTPANEEDRARVARFVPMTYENDLESLQTQMAVTTTRAEVWWGFLAGMIGFLCLEVAMTRRMVKNR